MQRRTGDVGNDEPAYRAYLIGHDKRIRSAVPIDAVTDEAAIESARGLVDGHAVELWDRGRKIVRFEAKD